MMRQNYHLSSQQEFLSNLSTISMGCSSAFFSSFCLFIFLLCSFFLIDFLGDAGSFVGDPKAGNGIGGSNSLLEEVSLISTTDANQSRGSFGTTDPSAASSSSVPADTNFVIDDLRKRVEVSFRWSRTDLLFYFVNFLIHCLTGVVFSFRRAVNFWIYMHWHWV